MICIVASKDIAVPYDIVKQRLHIEVFIRKVSIKFVVAAGLANHALDLDQKFGIQLQDFRLIQFILIEVNWSVSEVKTGLFDSCYKTSICPRVIGFSSYQSTFDI